MTLERFVVEQPRLRALFRPAATRSPAAMNACRTPSKVSLDGDRRHRTARQLLVGALQLDQVVLSDSDLALCAIEVPLQSLVRAIHDGS